MLKLMFDCLRYPLAWPGGRSSAEVLGPATAPAPTAALVGLALLASSCLAALGWAQWLAGTALAVWAQPAAVGMALLTLMFFRQLVRAHEAAPGRSQRAALGTMATLALLPGAWLAASELPPLLFQGQLAEHRAAVSQAAVTAGTALQHKQQQLGRLQQAVASRQLEVDRLTSAGPSWRAARSNVDAAAADCQRELDAQPEAPEETDTAEQRELAHELAVLAARCERHQNRAAGVRARFNERWAQPLKEATAALQAAKSTLQAAEAALTAAATAQGQAATAAQPRCDAVPGCAWQPAVTTGHLSLWEAWCTPFLVLAMALMPAFLRAVLPADLAARQRRLAATEEAFLDTAWHAGHRQAAAMH